MQWIKYSQKLNRKRSAVTTARFLLYNMEIGADLHKVFCCIFLLSVCPSRQDVPSVKSAVPSCPASTQSHQDVLLREFIQANSHIFIVVP